jgi:hypothetical protein
MKADTPDLLRSIIVAGTDPEQPVATFAALNRALQQSVGHQLLTILTFDSMMTMATRLYSSRPDAYPAGVRNAVASEHWAKSVIRDGLPFVGHQASDLTSVFAEPERMAALGLGSVINMPVRWRGATVGTVNVLDAEGRYADVDLEDVRTMAQLILPALMAVLR